MPACLGRSLVAQLRSATCGSHSCSASAKAFEEPVIGFRTAQGGIVSP